MAILAEYRMLSAPRFAADEMDVRLFDSFVGQRALCAHLALNLVREHGLTVELRIAHFDRIEVALRVHGIESPGARERIIQAEAMMPSGYTWNRVEPDLRLEALPMRMARIVRRLEYVDLPVPAANLDSDRDESDDEALELAPALASEGLELRRLPALDSVLDELYHERFCLPLPGPIDSLRPRARALFQEVQRDSPVAVSICMHPLEAAEHFDIQLPALAWKRFLDPFASTLASAGFAEAAALRSAYDRFSLPPGHLLHASIRVAGTSDRAVVGLANVVAANFGGFRAYQVNPPTVEVPGAKLHERALDVPSLWNPGRLQAQRASLLRQLRQARIAEEGVDGFLDFMMRVPHLYTLGEVEQLVRLPIADEEGLPGFVTESVPPFVVPSLALLAVADEAGNIAEAPEGRFRIGMVRRPGHSLVDGANGLAGYGWHTIDPADLTKHALVVGSTGSGKTLTTLFMARELNRLGIPFLVIEPVKTEYYGRLHRHVPGLRRLRFEAGSNGRSASDFLGFDPLRVPAGISVIRHVSYIKSCFEAAFPLTPILSLLLENALVEYYTGPKEDGCCAFGKFRRGGPGLGSIDRRGRVFPSYATFQSFLLGTFIDRAFSARPGSGSPQSDDFRDIFRRRFANLGSGLIGTSFRIADEVYRAGATKNGGVPLDRHYDLLADLLEQPTVVELDGIADAEQKALVMAFLLTYVFERRQAEDLEAREAERSLPPGLRHFLIVEEAHRLLSTGARTVGRGADVAGESSQAKAVGLFVDMLAEIRAFGQGLAVVEQIPTKIVSEAVKNTNLKIMLRLTASDDREYLGSAMNFSPTQQRFVTSLKIDRAPPGEGGRGRVNLVMFEENVEQPLLLALPLPDAAAPETWLYDDHF